ncbi:hypothetical protein FALBO_13127 [Fusarium albosuccineum]|uniref:DUF7708 domain-containing protein n=1 Tax=Fusarium albosuccineum TaxID=1237068 RepID=A0A8H4L2L9_9HYPO|nr:hypothetical protein FALBO_13127 [Fusarium albosuccineum]
MDSRIAAQAQPLQRRQNVHPVVYEVPEFMVRKLDGKHHPAFQATPGSGVVYSGSEQWVAEPHQRDTFNLDEIYNTCLQAQNSLVLKTNELCSKRKLPPVDITTSHSWSDVEESVLDACTALERLSDKDRTIPPGFTGKLNKAFRSLCRNAGAGTTLTNLVPTDSYCSVLCGGLKVIFKALEQTGNYRQEIYNALEELPFILNDNAALLDLHHKDEELHKRVASLYATIYRLMEVIISWFLKRSLVTGAKIFINPSGFSDRLKDSLAAVKISAQRFAARVAIKSAEEQRALSQQSYSMLYMQNQSSQQMSQEFGQLRHSNIILLGMLSDFLESQAKADQERWELRAQQSAMPQIEYLEMSPEGILGRFIYDPSLVSTDCENILRLRYIPGYDLDEDSISTVKSHPRVLSCLTLNESSLLLVDTRAGHSACNLEMPIFAAEIFRNLVDFSSKAAPRESSTNLVCLAFFCSRHQDFSRDENGNPAELVMSLLLQLLDRYRYFDLRQLGLAFDELDPTDIDSICSVFGNLISQLPTNVIVFVMVDDLRVFTQPEERKRGMIDVLERLLDIHRGGQYEATLKFLFASSGRPPFFMSYSMKTRY